MMFRFKLYIQFTCAWNFNTSHFTLNYSYWLLAAPRPHNWWMVTNIECKVKLGVWDVNLFAKYKLIIDIMKHLRWDPEVLISYPNNLIILLKKNRFHWDEHTPKNIFSLCLRIAPYYYIKEGKACFVKKKIFCKNKRILFLLLP